VLAPPQAPKKQSLDESAPAPPPPAPAADRGEAG
jgi:hypothetical protein